MRLHVMIEKKMVDQTIPILSLLIFVCKNAYKSKTKMKKENRVRDNIEIQ